MAPRARIALLGFAGLVLAGAAAHADNEPVVVIPGRPGVPVIIHGADATGAVVYGDWGLFRPGGAVVVEGGIWPAVALPPAPDWAPHYYPATGRTPAYGRKEIDPGPKHPGPAPAYHKSWVTESQPGPITEYPPFAPPEVVVTPPGLIQRSKITGASGMSVVMRVVAGAAALAALVLFVTSASACCGGCGCGYATYYQPVTVYRPVTVYAPAQPTYAVDQGPVYQVPAAVATEPVPEEYGYAGPGYGYGYRGWGYRGLGYRGWGYRGGLVHRAAYRGWRGGYRGYRGRW